MSKIHRRNAFKATAAAFFGSWIPFSGSKEAEGAVQQTTQTCYDWSSNASLEPARVFDAHGHQYFRVFNCCVETGYIEKMCCEVHETNFGLTYLQCDYDEKGEPTRERFHAPAPLQVEFYGVVKFMRPVSV